MKKTLCKYSCLFFTVFALLPISISAFDFGLITNQYMGLGGQGDEENNFNYKADILPRLSFPAGDTGDFILSAGFTMGVGNNEDFYFVPELLRTELSLRFGNSGIKAGRMSYSDPLNFIVTGLFDGIQFFNFSNVGTFNAGVWYTGLLYKKTANITMTANDLLIYSSELNFDDFSNTYFAPKRLLLSLDWGHPSIGELISLKTAITGQIDLSDEDGKYHSQYLTLKASIPAKSFLFELGGSLETAQTVSEIEDQFNTAFAWSFGLFWNLPTNINSRLSFTGNFAGGKVNDSLGAFVPVTTKVFGDIFQAKLSGITVLGLNYTARINHAVGTSFTASHFVRNDLGTFSGYPVISAESDGYSLGTEFFARLVWSPFSDLQFNLGGGAFIPALGNAGPDENAKWRFDLTAILALY